ncbi:TPA: capsular biosynthesis protein [Escherichia coli]|uniref:Capsular biosynthesis protein n=3 Tax=Escherichia coli TaxID=562 RepID=A0AAP1R8S2_ECOLX|nr:MULTISPECIES: capsule biosynthesis phosphatase [Enterobacteriaceae]EEW2550953.1 capsular biosynthesis protein [Escherichia coli]EEW2610450.1 capsular biosynthesis protein [Escherichia coli]EEZ7513444.1 capsular biosynthesis protein [Escherichia coli]EFA4931135.1 capsular biosynthesis protein [Escherichia coli]EFB1952447.1 capsular biosynthesis protein [Escherichia coli]
MKRIIFDLDNTISFTDGGDYRNAKPNVELILKMKEYKKNGFEIIISTSRNMRTYNGNVGLITANTLPIIIEWLNENDVPFDEIYVGKPWCGYEGFYVDDRAIRPDEFIKLSINEIKSTLGLK